MSASRLAVAGALGAVLALALSGPGLAKVVAEGPAKGGFYWQKVENSAGKVSYMCRAKAGAKLSPAASCDTAKAKKP
ncbi:MAG: hypothetical protein ACKOZT_02330 [Cyanobium sp.]